MSTASASRGGGQARRAGPVAVVTGASRGIGRAVAEDLAAHGYAVWLVARNATLLDEVVGQIRAAGGVAGRTAFDVSAVRDAPRVVEDIYSQTGRLDVVVNCAGVNRRGSMEVVTSQDYDLVMDVNVKGLLFFTQAALAYMHPGGAVVNVASVNAFAVLRGVGVYAASKAAVVNLTRAFAIDAASFGVRVNAVAPGFIRTDFNAALWQEEELTRWVLAATPAGRLGTPRDVVGAVRFLISEDSSFVTGETLVVDGGFSASRMWPLEPGAPGPLPPSKVLGK